MKKIIIISILLILIVFAILFGNFLLNLDNAKTNKYKIGFVINYIGDKGFADMQLEGVKKASEIYNLKYRLFLTNSYEAIKEGILKAIEEGCNIIICGNGFLSQRAVMEVASLYPAVYFIVMDTEFSDYPQNVATVSFKQNEGSFLVGVLAAKMTKNRSIGFIGGMNIPVINDFLVGFKQGIFSIDKNIKIHIKYIDQINIKNPFGDAESGFKLATELIEQNKVDIIYAVAGKSNLGIYDAIKNKNIFAIGVDTDQDYLVKGKILVSMMKNLDTGIIYIIEKIINNNFKNKNYKIGLKENGVALSQMLFTKELIGDEILNLIEESKIKIIKEQIIVETSYK